MDEILELKTLWKTVFGDPRETIDAYFSAFYSPELCVEERSDGHIISACHIMPLGDLVFPDSSRERCAAIYALATHPERRGRGAASRVTEEAVNRAKQQGYSSVILHPATEKLFGFYKKRGFRTAFRTRGILTARDCATEPERVSPAEYRALREDLLKGKLHVDHDERSLAFQDALCTLFGGGLFRTDGGCFIAEGSEIKELLGGNDAAGTAFSGLPGRAPCGENDGIPFGMIYGDRPAEDGWMGPVFD